MMSSFTHSVDDLDVEGYEIVPIGHIIFEPTMPMTPSETDLPIVVQDGEQVPHVVYAEALRDNNGGVGVDYDNRIVVRLRTVGFRPDGKSFASSTHLKNGRQYTGVVVADWSILLGDAFVPSIQMQKTTMRSVYSQVLRHVVDDLLVHEW